jgi:hypothetical protein
LHDHKSLGHCRNLGIRFIIAQYVGEICVSRSSQLWSLYVCIHKIKFQRNINLQRNVCVCTRNCLLVIFSTCKHATELYKFSGKVLIIYSPIIRLKYSFKKLFITFVVICWSKITIESVAKNVEWENILTVEWENRF